MTKANRVLLGLGFGYTARALAPLALAEGYEVHGTVRDAKAASELSAKGIAAIEFDGRGRSAQLTAILERVTHLLVSIPPSPDGDPALRWHGNDIAKAPALEWIGYLSTIGVYGDRGGGLVDETATPAPQTDRARRRLDAEIAWRNAAPPQVRLQIFRLPGIYGPGRSAVDDLLDGRARLIDKPGHVFNRIHVEDLGHALMLGMRGRGRTGVYNLADDEPATPADVMAYAAFITGSPAPPPVPLDSPEVSDMARSFYSEQKRVDSSRARAELGFRPRYPSFREGLRQVLTRRQGAQT